MIVPSLLNAGRRRPSDSVVVSARMPSSSANTIGSPRRCGTSTGTISSAKSPFFCAAAARWCERAAKRVLLLARQRVALVVALGGRTHGLAVEGVGEAVEGHRVDEFGVAVLDALARLRQHVWRVGHRLHAARDHDLDLAGTDQLVSQGDGVETAQAHLVDEDRRHGHRDAGLGRGLANRQLPGTGLQHLAHDHVVRPGRRARPRVRARP